MTLSSIFMAVVGILAALVMIVVSVGRVLAASAEGRDVVGPIVTGVARSVGAIVAAVFFVGFDAITLPLIHQLERAAVALITPAAAAMPSFESQSWTLPLLAFAIVVNVFNVGMMTGSRR